MDCPRSAPRTRPRRDYPALRRHRGPTAQVRRQPQPALCRERRGGRLRGEQRIDRSRALERGLNLVSGGNLLLTPELAAAHGDREGDQGEKHKPDGAGDRQHVVRRGRALPALAAWLRPQPAERPATAAKGAGAGGTVWAGSATDSAADRCGGCPRDGRRGLDRARHACGPMDRCGFAGLGRRGRRLGARRDRVADGGRGIARDRRRRGAFNNRCRRALRATGWRTSGATWASKAVEERARTAAIAVIAGANFGVSVGHTKGNERRTIMGTRIRTAPGWSVRSNVGFGLKADVSAAGRSRPLRNGRRGGRGGFRTG